jgi:DNA replication protein DnaC
VVLDRLLHRGRLLKFEGKSYRLKEASMRLTENKQKSQDEKGITMDH